MKVLADRRDRAGVLIAVLGIAILVALAPFASGLLGVGVLYAMGAPVHQWLMRYISREKSAVLVTVGAVVLVLAPVGALVGVAIDQAPDTLQSLQNTAILSRIAELRIGNVDVGNRIVQASGTVLSWFSGQAFLLVGSAARSTLNMVISLFGLYYMLQAADFAWPRFRAYLPFSVASAEALRAGFYSVTQAMLIGTALTALAQGALVGLGFWAVGLPNAVFWGVVTGFASIVPLFGSALIWLPGVGVLLLSQRYGAALVLGLVGGVLASNIDNLVRPMVYRRISNVHPVITIVGAFAGLKYFGLLGVLLGPLAIFYFFELLRIYNLEYGRDLVIAASRGEAAEIGATTPMDEDAGIRTAGNEPAFTGAVSGESP